MSALPHFPRFIAYLFAGLGLLLASGCYLGWPAGSSGGHALRGIRPSTALIIVIQGECTEAQYLAWRRQVVSYLIERGHIASEDELISDPAEAQRVFRALVSEGGFTLSVFKANAGASPPPDLEFTDIYYPADPYFIFGFLYFGEIGPRRLPPCPPDYRPHPRPPGTPPPQYPRYDRDWHRRHTPHGHDRPPAGPRGHDRPDQPAPPPPTRPPHRSPADRPNPSEPRAPREHPRERQPEPGYHRPPPSHAPPPPAERTPPPKPDQKADRQDEDKRPHRPEPER